MEIVKSEDVYFVTTAKGSFQLKASQVASLRSLRGSDLRRTFTKIVYDAPEEPDKETIRQFLLSKEFEQLAPAIAKADTPEDDGSIRME